MSSASPALAGEPSVIARPAPELTVVVPTFKERDNVPLLVEKLARALAGIDWEVVFVDDNSPDGTAAAARRDRRERRARALHPPHRAARPVGRLHRGHAGEPGEVCRRDGRRPAARRDAAHRDAGEAARRRSILRSRAAMSTGGSAAGLASARREQASRCRPRSRATCSASRSPIR